MSDPFAEQNPVLTRRRLLVAGAGAVATLGSAGMRGAQATTAQGRFDLSAPASILHWKKALRDETVLQSFAIDNSNGNIYTVQVKNGAASNAAGDLCLTRLNPSGTVTGYMYLLGFGHGVQIGVEPSGSSPYLWTETDGVRSGGSSAGRRIARFRFVNGQTLTTSSSALTKYAPVPNATRTTCTIDPSTNRLIMRYELNGQKRFAVYALAAVKAGGTPTPVFEVAQPGGLGVFQGYTAYGNYLYLLDGSAAGRPGDTHLTAVDLRTGGVVQRSFTQAAQSLDNREPEGMGIQMVGVRPSLCFGFASGVPGARKATIAFKDAML
ncbi:hypothetical protein SAMN05421505_14052 [Sinosporangium album]|uniref:P68 RBP/TagC-like beta-propeller domain-containing protein n=1 Tax=Sinosporangium album TaxID=504805 RepID=A0A1G8J2M1_9ACTN|nr:hypothetical protein [Sinosporangium album]SDI25207.1 hypothetical protein SAMN05421505_14052 [Sinosporangium album]